MTFMNNSFTEINLNYTSIPLKCTKVLSHGGHILSYKLKKKIIEDR